MQQHRCDVCLEAESWFRMQFVQHPFLGELENTPELRTVLKKGLDHQIASGSRALPCEKALQQIQTILTM